MSDFFGPPPPPPGPPSESRDHRVPDVIAPRVNEVGVAFAQHAEPWRDHGVELTRHDVDAQPILDAAARSRPLW